MDNYRQDKIVNYMPENQNLNNNQDEEDPNEQEVIKIYELVDSIPLSRPKKNITRDFSDGVLVAEIIKFFIPKIVELHNYITSNNLKTKTENWNTLNRKVLKNLNLKLSSDEIKAVVNHTPGYVEMVLQKVFNQLYAVGIDVQEVINQNTKKQLPQSQQENDEKYQNTKYAHVDDQYKQLLQERDDMIDELKIALEETEKNLKISEDNKKILNHQLDVLKNKIRELGLY